MKMKKLMTLMLTLLVPVSLTLGACNDDDDNGEDAGQDTSVTDAGDTTEEDTTDEDTTGEDTTEADTTEEDTSGDDTMAQDTGGDDTTGGDTTMADGGDGGGCGPGETPSEEDLKEYSGTVQMHTLTQQFDEEATLADAELTIIAASNAIGGGTPAPVQDGDCQPAVTSWGSDFMETMADWSFPEIDTSQFTLGAVSLVGHITEEPSDPKFLNTATGIASAPFDSDVTGSQVYAITMDAEGGLAEIIAPESDDISGPGDLASGGFIVMQFIDGDGNPAAGVAATEGGTSPGSDECSSDSGDRVENAYYPSSDWSSVEKGPCATTSDTGIAILPAAGFSMKYAGVHVDSETAYGSGPAAGNISGVAFIGFRNPVSN